MGDVVLVLAYTTLAGIALPIGALLAHKEHLRHGHFRRDFLCGLVSFGGGTLFAAVALVLVPEGLRGVDIAAGSVAFLLGALFFLLIDRAVERRGGKFALVSTVFLDDVPSLLALGAAVAAGSSLGLLLAILVAVESVAASFNAYRELNENGWSRRRALKLVSSFAFAAPASGLLGFYVLAPFPGLVAVLFLIAAGGILYLLYHDIVPLAYRKGHWVHVLGGVLGFLLGMITEAAVGG